MTCHVYGGVTDVSLVLSGKSPLSFLKACLGKSLL